MDPFDILKDGFDKLSTKMDSVLVDIASLKTHQKIIWSILMIFIAGSIGVFFYIFKLIIASHIGV